METGYLREFLVFSETLNYTHAAKRLYMSQPTLSSHIAALEKAVGAPLVEKGDGHLALTPAGKYLSSEARAVVRSVDAIVAECQRISATVVSLNVRMDTSYFDYVVDAARKLYHERHPEQEVVLNVVATPNGREVALDRGAIDFDIGGLLHLSEEGVLELGEGAPDAAGGAAGIVAFPQAFDRQLFWMTKENALFDSDAITANDLKGATIVVPAGDAVRTLGAQIEQVLARQGIQVQMAFRQFSSLQEYYMSDLGQAFGIASDRNLRGPGFYEAHALRRAFAIEGVDLHLETYTVYRPDLLSCEKREFVEILRELGASEARPR